MKKLRKSPIFDARKRERVCASMHVKMLVHMFVYIRMYMCVYICMFGHLHVYIHEHGYKMPKRNLYEETLTEPYVKSKKPYDLSKEPYVQSKDYPKNCTPKRPHAHTHIHTRAHMLAHSLCRGLQDVNTQGVAVCCSVLQCVAVCCCLLLFIAECGGVLKRATRGLPEGYPRATRYQRCNEGCI